MVRESLKLVLGFVLEVSRTVGLLAPLHSGTHLWHALVMKRRNRNDHYNIHDNFLNKLSTNNNILCNVLYSIDC